VTAEDRAQALGARVDAARSAAVGLRSWISEREATAHQAHVAADFEAAEAALAEVAPLRAELADAESTLATLELAQREVSDQVRVEQHQASLVAAERRYESALSEARELLAEVAPGLDAVQRTLRAALASEQEAGRAGAEAHSLRIALGAQRTLFSSPAPVRGSLEQHPLWNAVANHRPGD
jgi:chromosome segregation ATPase